MNFLTLQSNFLTLAFSVLFPDMYFLTFLDTVVLFLDTRVSSTPTWREFLDSRVNFLTVPVRNFLTLQSNFLFVVLEPVPVPVPVSVSVSVSVFCHAMVVLTLASAPYRARLSHGSRRPTDAQK
eukprot:COSAG02_NODE_1938_length_10312_cov_16.495741_4_plen_124_part_00